MIRIGIGHPHRVEWGIAPVFNWRFCKMLKTILCDNKLNWTWWITQCCFNKLCIHSLRSAAPWIAVYMPYFTTSGVWNSKGWSWKRMDHRANSFWVWRNTLQTISVTAVSICRGSIKSKGDGLWTTHECTGHSELLVLLLVRFLVFALHVIWDESMRQIDAGAFRGFGVQPLAHPLILPWGVHVRSAESPRGTGDNSGGKGFFGWGRRRWQSVFLGGFPDPPALVHDSNRMTVRAMRRRPAMKQQQPFEEKVS